MMLLFAGTLATQPALAVTVGDYQKWRHDTRTLQATPTGLIEVRIGGILHGLSIANQQLTKAGGPVLYCEPNSPKSVRLAGSAVRKLLDKELKSPSRFPGTPWPAQTRISAVILYILQRTWPCPTDKKMLQ